MKIIETSKGSTIEITKVDSRIKSGINKSRSVALFPYSKPILTSKSYSIILLSIELSIKVVINEDAHNKMMNPCEEV